MHQRFAQSSVAPVTGPVHSKLKKAILLCLFCFAQFLDTFNVSSVYAGIPSLEAVMGITANEAPWIVAAFQLTFAAFLLVSGKISDVYNPKHAFIVGIAGLGILCLITGFVDDKIAHFVLRALAGVFASLTIPASLTLIVQVFPNPTEQANAISIFGGSAGFGNTLGVIVGAIFVEYTTWRWIYWFCTAVAIPIAILGVFMIPAQPEKHAESNRRKLGRLDIPGVTGITIAVILFIYALTAAPAEGWPTAGVLAPLIISVFLVVGFFFWERTLPVHRASVPTKTWFLPNFSILFGVSLLPTFWWTNMATVLVPYWNLGFGWSIISVAVHMLPNGVAGFLFAFTGGLSRIISPKWIILAAHFPLIAATVLLALADRADEYWRYTFPALCIGSASCMVIYTHANIAIFRGSPPAMAGTVGAIFNFGLQGGSAIGISIVGSIQNGINKGEPLSFRGREAGFWFTLGVVVVELISVAIFMRAHIDPPTDESTFPQEKKEQETQSSDPSTAP
ncbi:MFS general substrate transporter [Pterulicium gracile]|uniref:MFS general substrate transporter n=1 Tax=Pterulicium gracile TaxID=1884261 RepID=A0A5C3Q7L7_9AGAR|nr:MFS general substrate transporter [Pterula gracilis]